MWCERMVCVWQEGWASVGEKGKYFLVKEKAVPEILLKVVEAKKLLESEKVMTIQEATDVVGISRSSFYKYKDDIGGVQGQHPDHLPEYSCELHCHSDHQCGGPVGYRQSLCHDGGDGGHAGSSLCEDIGKGIVLRHEGPALFGRLVRAVGRRRALRQARKFPIRVQG